MVRRGLWRADEYRPEPRRFVVADQQFTVDQASAGDGVIKFDVTPHEGYARNLLQPVLQRDLAYASCGGYSAS